MLQLPVIPQANAGPGGRWNDVFEARGAP